MASLLFRPLENRVPCLDFTGRPAWTQVGIHTLAVLPEQKLVYIYRYDTDGEFQDPGQATIQLIAMIMGARQDGGQIKK